ncbi:UNVERIFIED_CONTAM: hypothetical protein Scaly_2248100 [Sesamum calycinum]|uniref:Uncharacterized protein n=1 Tax=Sesamum calycinum TaxID=2727403 RepID=A0AAW2M9M8_9LAMI
MAVERKIMNESGLANRLSNIVHAADQSLWDGCTQSQLGVVVELMDIKVDGHISEKIYDRISQWANRILSFNHTLPGDYYSTKKLVKDLGLHVEKIHACTSLLEGETYTKEVPVCCLQVHAADSPSVGVVFFEGDCRAHETMNNLPDYGIASRWSTVGVMRCPVCMDDTRAFHLHYGRKACYFDCHKQFLHAHHSYRMNKKTFTKNRVENKVVHPRLTGDQILDWVANINPTVEMSLSLHDGYDSDHKWTKKNIFWDLPYWSTLLIRHNLDVMHIEKNVFHNIFNTVMDIKGKTKDNMNAHRDLKIICNHPEL